MITSPAVTTVLGLAGTPLTEKMVLAVVGAPGVGLVTVQRGSLGTTQVPSEAVAVLVMSVVPVGSGVFTVTVKGTITEPGPAPLAAGTVTERVHTVPAASPPTHEGPQFSVGAPPV